MRGEKAISGTRDRTAPQYRASAQYAQKGLPTPRNYLDQRREYRQSGFYRCFWHASDAHGCHVRTDARMNPLLAHLLEAAARSPSTHNTQPWVLSWREDELRIRLDRERMLPAADPEGSDAAHSLGAAIENLLLTLSQLGLEGQYSVSRTCESEPVLILRWRKSDGPRPDPSLYRMIPIRSTVRLRYSREPIPGAVLDDITRAAQSPSRLYVLTDERAIDEIRSLAALASAKLLENENHARELYRWLRFSRRHPDWYRDGLN